MPALRASTVFFIPVAMKMIYLFFFLLPFWIPNAGAQSSTNASPSQYGVTSIFAHNDYDQALPFYAAYNYRVGYIEVDIFLQEDRLLVAHHFMDLNVSRNLEQMYLNPLDSVVRVHDGRIYPGSDQRLTLSIDLKTNGVATLNKLVNLLGRYPELIRSPYFTIIISGSVPDPALWDHYPSYIHFDGRPGIPYTESQWSRIELVSIGFRTYSNWSGVGNITESDDHKIKALIKTVHAHHKKLRFWATPDLENIWNYLMVRQVDVIGTDTVKALYDYLHR